MDGRGRSSDRVKGLEEKSLPLLPFNLMVLVLIVLSILLLLDGVIPHLPVDDSGSSAVYPSLVSSECIQMPLYTAIFCCVHQCAVLIVYNISLKPYLLLFPLSLPSHLFLPSHRSKASVSPPH